MYFQTRPKCEDASGGAASNTMVHSVAGKMAEQWWRIVVCNAGGFAITAQRGWPNDGRVHRHRKAPGRCTGEARRIGSRTVRRWVIFLSISAKNAIVHRPLRQIPSLSLHSFSLCFPFSFSLTLFDSPRATSRQNPLEAPLLLIKSITPYSHCRLHVPAWNSCCY